MKMLLGKRAENICWGLLGLAIGASSAYFWLIEGDSSSFRIPRPGIIATLLLAGSKA